VGEGCRKNGVRGTGGRGGGGGGGALMDTLGSADEGDWWDESNGGEEAEDLKTKMIKRKAKCRAFRKLRMMIETGTDSPAPGPVPCRKSLSASRWRRRTLRN